jgi:hypothetical protein
MIEIWDQIEQAIIDGLQSRLPEVDVLPGWPGDELAPETIFASETSATSDVPTLQAGRNPRNDYVTTTWEIRAWLPGQDITEARNRVSTLIATFDDFIAEEDTLADINGVVYVTFETARRTCGRLAEGVVGFGQVSTTVHCRLD